MSIKSITIATSWFIYGAAIMSAVNVIIYQDDRWYYTFLTLLVVGTIIFIKGMKRAFYEEDY